MSSQRSVLNDEAQCCSGILSFSSSGTFLTHIYFSNVFFSGLGASKLFLVRNSRQKYYHFKCFPQCSHFISTEEDSFLMSHWCDHLQFTHSVLAASTTKACWHERNITLSDTEHPQINIYNSDKPWTDRCTNTFTTEEHTQSTNVQKLMSCLCLLH